MDYPHVYDMLYSFIWYYNKYTSKYINMSIKKEIVYTMPYTTEKEIQEAGELRQDLYSDYDSVLVYPNGLHEVRIVATDEIVKCVECGVQMDALEKLSGARCIPCCNKIIHDSK